MTEWIAEIGNAHNGDLGRAFRLLDAAKAAGASAAKFQCYLPEELLTLRGDGPAPGQWGEQGYTMRSLYERAKTPHDWFPALVVHCEEIGLPWFSSVFGPESLALLESLNCPRYKLAALDEDAPGLLDAVWATGKPVIRSTNNLDAEWWPDGLLLLCPPSYPQPRAHLRLLWAGNFDGYSYHGPDPLVPALASGVYGVEMVEVHFQLEAEPSELEANVSLTEKQFAEMVVLARKIESAM